MKTIPTFFILLATAAPLIGQADRAASTVILDDNGVQNLQIETVEVEERDFETTVFAIGRIEEIPSNRAVLSSRIAGRVLELNAYLGDTVEAGQELAVVESRQLGDPPPTVSLVAPQRGLVVDSHIRLGQPVEPEQELLDIADFSRLWAVAKIPEREAAQIGVGTRAYIRIPALGEQWQEARLSQFGVEADRAGGTVDGIFVLDNLSGKLRPGMRAEFSIVLSSRKNVLAIPREAVQGDPASRVVFVEDFELPNAFIRSPVVLGEQNDRFVEVVRGLFPGDEVVTQGSYALSFTGGGSGMSLKEALDAAHGHEHNEDGSEMTPEQQAAYSKEKHDHAGEVARTDNGLSKPLLTYAVVVTALLLIAVQQLLRKRKPSTGSQDAE